MPRKKERPPRFVVAIPMSLGGGGATGIQIGGANDDMPGEALMMEILGRILSLLRRRFRIRQVEMADRLSWPQSVVSRIENGEVNVTVEQLDAWCTVINTEAARVRPGDFAVSAAQALEILDYVSFQLIKAGVNVQWETARLAGMDEERLRGVELENFVVDHWPPGRRALL